MRLEYKYIVPTSKINKLRQQLMPFLEYDPYSTINDDYQYTVKSIYLDSIKFRNYYDVVEGLYKRKKVRIRGYNDVKTDSKVFLEIKKKLGSHIYKNRSIISYNELKNFLKNKNLELIESKKNHSDAEKFLFHYIRDSLNHVTLVTYEREAFFSRFDKSLRITFDKNLRYKKVENCDALLDDHPYQKINDDFFILEIKFTRGFPNWLQKILQSQNLKRQSFSKYTNSVEETINLIPTSNTTNSR